MILSILSYVGIAVGFVFLTLAIAAGLYYLSELVEEHSTYTKNLLEKLIYAISVVHVLLLVFDRFPFWLTVFSLVSQGVYYQNLRQFPFIQLSSSTFIASCVLVLLNHYFWFQHFSKPSVPPPAMRSSPLYVPPSSYATFSEISSFFGICVWLIPFALFVSLSAGDNVLPSTAGGPSSAGAGHGGLDDRKQGARKGTGLAKVVVSKFKAGVEEVCRVVGWGDDYRSGGGRLV
ncbi:transmembrane adaptor Erv26 [Dipodascopsis tothii]|uniref:transmembrane adaptor Erv26 n=1 Tax=Dipodascopsis tothii TaxID=44089 RepID=UPI0034CD537B